MWGNGAVLGCFWGVFRGGDAGGFLLWLRCEFWGVQTFGGGWGEAFCGLESGFKMMAMGFFYGSILGGGGAGPRFGL